MRLYSTGHLAFGVKIPRHVEEGLEVSDILRDFNLANGARLTYLTAGSFENDDLYLVTYCENTTPRKGRYVSFREFPRKRQTVWKRQIEKFLREHKIEALDRIGLRLITDLDN